jgi:2-methylcitrate dehydratase
MIFGEGVSMPIVRLRAARSARVGRRDVLLAMAAAGLATGLPAFPVIAQNEGGPPMLAETLARYAAGLKYEDIPEDVVRLAKRTILDTIGCAFGGYDAGPSKIAIKLAGDVTAKQPATVLISGTRTAPDLAVFANGVMIRYLDFNDAFVSLTHGAGHPSHRSTAVLGRDRGTQWPRPRHRDRAFL